jgi:hypothetical protein
VTAVAEFLSVFVAFAFVLAGNTGRPVGFADTMHKAFGRTVTVVTTGSGSDDFLAPFVDLALKGAADFAFVEDAGFAVRVASAGAVADTTGVGDFLTGFVDTTFVITGLASFCLCLESKKGQKESCKDDENRRFH